MLHFQKHNRIMAKTATIFHPVPTKAIRLMVVPIGLFANKEIQNCEVGGVITFADTWRRTKFRLVRKCKLPVKSSAFNFVLKSLYGDTITYDRYMERWQGVAVSEGWGKDCFSDEVLLIEIEMIE